MATKQNMELQQQQQKEQESPHLNHTTDDKEDTIDMKNNTINKDKTKQYDTDVDHDRCKLCKNIYVIVALVVGFGIAGLKAVLPKKDPFNLWLKEAEEDMIRFFEHESVWWLILAIAILTGMKSVSIKDVFGLRSITVVLLSWKMTDKSEVGTLIVAMLIMGVLSSISKLIEYRAIGKELQFIIGTPTKYILKFIRQTLIKCCAIEEDKVKWIATKYTLEISYKSRNDPRRSIINNFQLRYGSGVNDENKRTCKWYSMQALVWISAVLWTSCVEWVQPITELFLFAHNWRFSASNVVIIVLAELADFDKAVEVGYMIEGIKKGSIIEAKVDQLKAKSFFWMAGYTIILFPTLWWAYVYHQRFIEEDQDTGRQVSQDMECVQVDNESRKGSGLPLEVAKPIKLN